MVHRSLIVSEIDLKKYTPIKNGGLFIFVHMHGCPFCEAMLQQWFQFQNTSKYNTLMIERGMLPKLKRIDTRLKQLEPTHFPFLVLVPNINNPRGAWIKYTDSSDRTATGFEEFVKRNTQQKRARKTTAPKQK